MQEFTKGAPDYEAIQELFTFVKKWRSVEWTESNREMASAARVGIYNRLKSEGKPWADLTLKLLEGYDYGRDAENK